MHNIVQAVHNLENALVTLNMLNNIGQKGHEDENTYVTEKIADQFYELPDTSQIIQQNFISDPESLQKNILCPTGVAMLEKMKADIEERQRIKDSKAINPELKRILIEHDQADTEREMALLDATTITGDSLLDGS